MTKYNFLFKQRAIEFYLQNAKNCSLTRKHFQLASRALRHWANQFNYSGINGLAMLGKKRNDSPEFKLNVIQAVKNGQFSAETAYLYFGIANSSVINRWLRVFEKQGINGLIPKPKDRPTMKPKYPKMPPKPKTREEELALENLRLRAENEILKKLQELNQQKMQKKLLS